MALLCALLPGGIGGGTKQNTCRNVSSAQSRAALAGQAPGSSTLPIPSTYRALRDAARNRYHLRGTPTGRAHAQDSPISVSHPALHCLCGESQNVMSLTLSASSGTMQVHGNWRPLVACMTELLMSANIMG